MKLFDAHRCKITVVCLAAVLLELMPFSARALPDLAIAGYVAKTTIEYQRRWFTTGDCAYQEGCVRGIGGRKLLLLDVGVKNLGTTDLVIGDPNRRPDLFVWSGCHGHFHFKGLALYRVLTASGQAVTKSYKQGFCLRDDTPAKNWNGSPPKYTCDYQGISVGWQDTYDKSLDCQWVDITGVPPGNYYLEITVNPYHILKESNYKNNKIILPITVPRYVYY
jgi:lysyl oxidase